MKMTDICKIFKFVVLALLSVSCSSELDFNQVNDLKLEPVFVANLTSFDIPANDFVDNGTEQSIALDVQDFNPFRNKLMREDLMQVEFDFEIANTIARGYKIDLVLINAQNQPIETISFNVMPYSGSSNVLKFKEVFENQRLVNLKKITQIGFVVTMSSGTPLNENSLGSLKLKSSATLHFLIEG